MKVYDLIILGAGPAGITAAVYAVRKQLDFLVITQDIGGQAAWSGDIENYTGYQFITGPELALKFQEHMESFKIPVHMPEKVEAMVCKDKIINVKTDKGSYDTRSVIIATGKRSRELGVQGESEYKNKGLTYCATCDGPIFRGKAVAVIGAGNSALDAALSLMKLCPKVYIINRSNKVDGDVIMLNKLRSASNVEILDNTAVRRVYGDTFVKGIEIESAGQNKTLEVAGVFVEIGLIPNSEWSSAIKKNQRGEIIVDCHNRTDKEGVFAAGDVTSVPEKQIIIACGEGSKACLSVFKYLSINVF
jgi:NADH-dependent peroxiredoxin subunit F